MDMDGWRDHQTLQHMVWALAQTVHQDACILQNSKQELGHQREHPLAVAAFGVAAGVAPGVAAGEAPVTAGDAAGFTDVPTGAGNVPGLAGDMGEPASELTLSHLSQPF